MGNFRKLEVWQKARELTNRVYDVTDRFPVRERFGLVAQMQRSAVSIMANIAEGCGRNRNAELMRFLGIARSSATELESHVVVAEDRCYLDRPSGDELNQRVSQIQRMLTGLIRKLGTPNQ
ncbi:MAG: four helix bundle protein [Gemmatimonadales bacterium]